MYRSLLVRTTAEAVEIHSWRRKLAPSSSEEFASMSPNPCSVSSSNVCSHLRKSNKRKSARGLFEWLSVLSLLACGGAGLVVSPHALSIGHDFSPTALKGRATRKFSSLENAPSLLEFGGANMIIERRGHTATLLSDGRVLIVGGENANGTVGPAEIFDPAANTFSLHAGNDPIPASDAVEFLDRSESDSAWKIRKSRRIRKHDRRTNQKRDSRCLRAHGESCFNYTQRRSCARTCSRIGSID